MPSIFKHPSLILNAILHPLTFALGFYEARSSNGMTYDDDPESPRSRAYDAGRDFRTWGRG